MELPRNALAQGDSFPQAREQCAGAAQVRGVPVCGGRGVRVERAALGAERASERSGTSKLPSPPTQARGIAATPAMQVAWRGPQGRAMMEGPCLAREGSAFDQPRRVSLWAPGVRAGSAPATDRAHRTPPSPPTTAAADQVPSLEDIIAQDAELRTLALDLGGGGGWQAPYTPTRQAAPTPLVDRAAACAALSRQSSTSAVAALPAELLQLCTAAAAAPGQCWSTPARTASLPLPPPPHQRLPTGHDRHAGMAPSALAAPRQVPTLPRCQSLACVPTWPPLLHSPPAREVGWLSEDHPRRVDTPSWGREPLSPPSPTRTATLAHQLQPLLPHTSVPPVLLPGASLLGKRPVPQPRCCTITTGDCWVPGQRASRALGPREDYQLAGKRKRAHR